MTRTFIRCFLTIQLLVFLPLLTNAQNATEIHLDPWTTKAGEQGTYFKMVNWDSAPYKEYTYLKRTGPDVNNIIEYLNFRMLFPEGYDSTAVDNQLYPMIVMLHGAGESGLRWSGHFDYGAGFNGTPPEPDKVDNNDHHLLFGGKEFMDAGKLPSSDPRAFKGFVVFPQARYNAAWSGVYSSEDPTENNRQVIELVEMLVDSLKIDPNRIYVLGLSNGGRGAWDLVNRRPDLFAASAIFSAVGDRGLMSDKLAHFPFWIFQGGTDINPTPSATYQMIDGLEASGGSPRLTVYDNLGHGVWNRAFTEPDFYSWLLSNNKLRIFVHFGETHFPTIEEISAKLEISPGYSNYQWKYNGEIINDSVRNIFIADTPGAYQVRFLRENVWTGWSDPVFITSDEEINEPEALPVAFRINVGAETIIDEPANWSADGELTPSPYKMITDDQDYYTNEFPLINYTLVPDELYESGIQVNEENGSIEYQFPFQGKAKVSLYFSVPSQSEVIETDRIFNITMEDQIVANQFNLTQESGGDALKKSFEVDVTDNGLNISLEGITGSPTLSGIEIRGINNYGITGLDDDLIGEVTVFPNPFWNELKIDLGTNRQHIEKISIYDINGRLISNHSLTATSKQHIIYPGANNLSPGVYFLRIIFRDKKNATYSIIKN